MNMPCIEQCKLSYNGNRYSFVVLAENKPLSCACEYINMLRETGDVVIIPASKVHYACLMEGAFIEQAAWIVRVQARVYTIEMINNKYEIKKSAVYCSTDGRRLC